MQPPPRPYPSAFHDSVDLLMRTIQTRTQELLRIRVTYHNAIITYGDTTRSACRRWDDRMCLMRRHRPNSMAHHRQSLGERNEYLCTRANSKTRSSVRVIPPLHPPESPLLSKPGAGTLHSRFSHGALKRALVEQDNHITTTILLALLLCTITTTNLLARLLCTRYLLKVVQQLIGTCTAACSNAKQLQY